MIKKIKQWLVIVFLLLTVALVSWFKYTQQKILVLQSYGPDYAWTRDVDIGLKRVLDKSMRYKVQWHYMDTKKHPDADFKRRAGILAMHEIRNFRPDLVIAVDDDAQKYAMQNYVNDPKLKIVFAGTNGSVTPYGYDHASNVTGIYERIPLGSLRTALMEMRDRNGAQIGRRILVLSDRSDTVMMDSAYIEAMDWSPFRLAGAVHAGTFDEWKRAVEGAAGWYDLILILNYQNVLKETGRRELAPPAQIMAWTEANSTVPVIGTGNWMVEDGGMLALGSSGFEQGEVSARLAMQILDNNKSPSDVPQVMPHQDLVYMRKSVMDKRGLVLPEIYEAFARALNNYYP